jgi:hypothetical protein
MGPPLEWIIITDMEAITLVLITIMVTADFIRVTAIIMVTAECIQAMDTTTDMEAITLVTAITMVIRAIIQATVSTMVMEPITLKANDCKKAGVSSSCFLYVNIMNKMFNKFLMLLKW